MPYIDIHDGRMTTDFDIPNAYWIARVIEPDGRSVGEYVYQIQTSGPAELNEARLIEYVGHIAHDRLEQASEMRRQFQKLAKNLPPLRLVPHPRFGLGI